ncbi:MAG: hypothetical protein KJ625_00200, partial [Actinobacteria bacterium]|nr:hypothetical protein [Actinomycetota bacterium]
VTFVLLAPRPTARADDFVVTDPGDSGPGTLRKAIEDANTNGEPDTITFSSEMTIQPSSSYTLTEGSTTIDAGANTVVIDAQLIPGPGSQHCFLVMSDGNTIKGLRVVGTTAWYSAIAIYNSSYNTVSGCFIGTRDGQSPDPNGYGIVISGNGNVIGGDTPGDRNVISGNDPYGVGIIGGSNNVVKGNYIGVDQHGNNSMPNQLYGVVVMGGSSGTEIGNEISGNVVAVDGGWNVAIMGAEGTVVSGNHIGLNAAGDSPAASSPSYGVIIVDSSNNAIGGQGPASRNVISGNINGVVIAAQSEETTGNVVTGNYIGTNADGDSAIPNGVGVGIFGGKYNVIGGDSSGERNVISGNNMSGVYLVGIPEEPVTENNMVSGNYIGTDVTGVNPIPNLQDGVRIDCCRSNLIGGDIPLEGNVISGNAGSGIRVYGVLDLEAYNNVISANHIGCGKRGEPIPNGAGIDLGAYAQNNRVGGAGTQEGNTISGNTAEGIVLSGTDNYNNAIIGNFFEGNGGLAVDIAPDPGPNAPPGSFPYPTPGRPNLWMSMPEMGSALEYESGTTVTGTCVPDSIVRLYRAAEDPTGYGEGAEYLGWAQCDGDGEFSRENLTLEAGETVTALATDRSGNSSEFSMCVTVLDRVPPHGSVAINNGAPQTTESLVKLYLDAYDNVTPKDKMRMMVSNSQGFTGASWEAFTEQKEWELPPGLGKRTVYVKYMDEVGNVSPAYSDDIEVVQADEPPAISPVWYFAEGCTRDPFQEWIVIMNPNGEDAYIGITLYMPGEVVERKWRVEPYRRGSLHLDSAEEIDGRDVAVKIVATDKYGTP